MDAGPILERLNALHPKRIDLSLGRLERLLERLDHPEKRLPPVIHIAGTNGKGSVTAMLRAMLEADGKRAHVYISPHLVAFNERIRLAAPAGEEGGGRLVSDAALSEVLERVEAANAGEPITFFEITTAAAFVLFAETPADAVVLETGLGGRLDATNVVEKPLAAVLTSIGIDHIGFLGPTLGEITMEKTGIIKRGVPVVSAPQKEAVAAIIEREAGRRRAPLHLGGMDWTVSAENGRLVFQDEAGLVDLPLPRLPGRHQVVNAGTAIAAARVAGVLDHPSSLEAGMTEVDWPGRMHRITKGRLLDWAPPDADLWLDGGHNADAGEAVAAALADLEDRVPRPLFLICGMLTTKDPAGYFRHFAGLVRHVFTVDVPMSDSAIAPAALAEAASEAGLSAEPVTSLRTALRRLTENWRYEPPPRIVICGSLYLVGDALAQNGTPPV